MKLKTLKDFEVEYSYGFPDMRDEAVNWINTIRECKVSAADVPSIHEWDRQSCANLLKMFPDFKEPRISDIDTMCFILMKFFNITEDDLK